MRLDDIDPSRNVRDLGGGGGGGGGIPFLGLLPLLLGRGRMGCGGIGLLAVIAIGYLLMSGGGGLLSGGGSGPVAQGGSRGGDVACDTQAEMFSCRVLATTEQTWSEIFRRSGQTYRAPTLNFYQGGTRSGCGQASSATGPFYCPGDQGVYLDTSFFDELANRFGAAGDFAQAYVIAHEVGHHVQQLLGTSAQVQDAMRRGSQAEGNAMSVRLELQADCYAGVWGYANRGRLEPGDIQEGMRAAEAIGDDTLTQGRASPESFTHGTSEQRQRWLNRGLTTGDPAQCDTFSGAV